MNSESSDNTVDKHGAGDDTKPKTQDVSFGWCLTERIFSQVHGVIDRIVRPDEQFSCEDILPLPSFPIAGQVERMWDACCGGGSTGAVDSPVPSLQQVNDFSENVELPEDKRSAVPEKLHKKPLSRRRRQPKSSRDLASGHSARDVAGASSMTGVISNQSKKYDLPDP